MKKRLKLPQEATYFLSIVIMSFAVAMLTAADYGLSMIVAPAYLLSLKISFLSFGTGEYVVQAFLLILMCLLIKKFKPIFLAAFLTCVIYGAALDFWRLVIPAFNPSITPVGSLPTYVRIILFVLGTPMVSLAVALAFRSYLYPQVPDFFVKTVSDYNKIKLSKLKTIFDLSYLVVSIALSLIFFGKLVGVGWGTFVIAAVNGFLIGLFGKILDNVFSYPVAFKKAERIFNITAKGTTDSAID